MILWNLGMTRVDVFSVEFLLLSFIPRMSVAHRGAKKNPSQCCSFLLRELTWEGRRRLHAWQQGKEGRGGGGRKGKFLFGYHPPPPPPPPSTAAACAACCLLLPFFCVPESLELLPFGGGARSTAFKAFLSLSLSLPLLSPSPPPPSHHA